MRLRLPALTLLAALAASSAAAVRWGLEWDALLVVRPVDGQLLFGQSAGGEDGPRTYQKIRVEGERRSAQFGFSNFNRDRLEISLSVPEAGFQAYNNSFGYKKEEIDALRQWRDGARQAAYQAAVRAGKGQAQLDAEVAAVDAEYAKRLREYLASKGFRMEKDNVVTVDMPALVKRNAPMIKSLALAFEREATARRYSSPDIIGAVLSFVQTALHYRQPDPVYKGKHTGGLLPPITAVLVGWGDCDTKTGVLGSILANWAQMRMVGIGVPGHYLMAVLQIPEKGDVFVTHDGLQYVLVEPAGPAWFPPGTVAETTMALLRSREGYRIEPFF